MILVKLSLPGISTGLGEHGLHIAGDPLLLSVHDGEKRNLHYVVLEEEW